MELLTNRLMLLWDAVAVLSEDLLRQDYDDAMKLVTDIMGEANRSSVMEGKVHVMFQNNTQPIPKGNSTNLATVLHVILMCNFFLNRRDRGAVPGPLQEGPRPGQEGHEEVSHAHRSHE